MYVTHTNSVYSEEITLLDYLPIPQYVHQVLPGGMIVNKGLSITPIELTKCLFNASRGASEGTVEAVQVLTKDPECRTGFILAAGGNIWSGYLSNIKRTSNYPTYKVTPMGVTQVQAGYLANKLGSFDYISTDSTSCISGHAGWFAARNLLALDILDAVVVVAVDNGTSEEYLSVFAEHGLAKIAKEEGDPDITKFRLGQGGNVTIFESEQYYNSHSRLALGKLHGIHIAAESYTSPLGIACTGEGYSKAIAGVDCSGIDFVKTHSTFSKDNDIEQVIINKQFGEIPVINYKLRIGHTMGAATAVETAIAIKEESGTFLSLGAGMGNVFSAAVVEVLT